jgi:hypothetical protein
MSEPAAYFVHSAGEGNHTGRWEPTAGTPGRLAGRWTPGSAAHRGIRAARGPHRCRAATRPPAHNHRPDASTRESLDQVRWDPHPRRRRKGACGPPAQSAFAFTPTAGFTAAEYGSALSTTSERADSTGHTRSPRPGSAASPPPRPAALLRVRLIASRCDVVTVQRNPGRAQKTTTLNTYGLLGPSAEDRTRAEAAGLVSAVLGDPAGSVQTNAT